MVASMCSAQLLYMDRPAAGVSSRMSGAGLAAAMSRDLSHRIQ